MTAPMDPAGPPPGSALARVDRLEVLIAILAKAAGLANIAIALLSAGSHFPTLTGPLFLALAVAAETIALCGYLHHRGLLPPKAVAADALFCAAALTANALLEASDPRLLHTWGFFVYPFSVISPVLIGACFGRFPVMYAWSALLGATYIAISTTLTGEPVWNAVPNSVTYFVVGPIAWLIDRELRRTARSADHNRAEAVTHAAIAAKERERARHQRLLHDRVLQTMELLAQGQPLPPTRIAEEALWLRALVNGTDPDQPGDLLTALGVLVRRHTRDGLTTDLLASTLHQPDSPHHTLTPDATAALLGATHEALTNIRKHAGTDHATLHATADTRHVTISVLDHGRGYDPATITPGTGLTHSVHGRIHDAGGTVTIDTTPGDGTRVELCIPLTGSPPRLRETTQPLASRARQRFAHAEPLCDVDRNGCRTPDRE
ncbi:ATP-binding protein [Streptomyces sp. V4-01]|uniref:ATP-binding protein n=1 Tax=Actinacidiphila polyblastidii TaxID=3110430 RepID=A0ABU7PK90_9ACTN|nr:ATP-binding protein [Streptomyces sp. V4-01]